MTSTKPPTALAAAAALSVLAVSCSEDKPDGAGPPSAGGAAPAAPAAVYTSFYPLQFFASQIARGRADVVCPMPPDADPVTWRPGDAEVAAFQGADLILLNGAGFESWPGTVSLPENKTVVTADALTGALIRYEDAVTHSHGEDGEEHTHEGLDGHTWLDPHNATEQARAVAAALTEAVPAAAAAFAENLAALEAELAGLGEALAAAAPQGTRLLASHPAYNYLARRFGWEIANLDLDLDPAAALSPGELAEIRGTLAEHPTSVILWESDPLPATAEVLAQELGLTSVTFAPCEQPPDAGDYLSTMRDNITRLEAALPQQ